MPVAHSYKLGKDQYFAFAGGIANKDVQSVTITRETSAEAEVTTRGSDNVNEFVPVRMNTQYEVVVLDHTCAMHGTGVATISGASGLYYVNGISEPQEIDGVVAYTVTLKRHAGV